MLNIGKGTLWEVLVLRNAIIHCVLRCEIAYAPKVVLDISLFADDKMESHCGLPRGTFCWTLDPNEFGEPLSSSQILKICWTTAFLTPKSI